MPAYQIKRGNDTLVEVFATGSKVEAVMDVTIATLQFNLPFYEDFKFGDSIVFEGLLYKINSKPLWSQASAANWIYSLQFQAEHYDLNKVQLLGLDDSNNPTETEFSYTGTAIGLIDLIILNVNRLYPGWTRGTVDETSIETFEFQGDTCRYGLTQLSDKYGIEFFFNGKAINFTTQGVNTGLTFKRGMGDGLIEVGIEEQDNNFATRWYIEGSDKNIIPSEYGHTRLQLSNGLGYLEDPAKVSLYGVIEGTTVFEDIMPSRTGSVTSTNGLTTMADSTLDFDIDDARVSNDIDPKVVFKTGLLAGLTFTIQSYDNASKTITVIPNDDNNSKIMLPSTATPITVADTYTLIDLNLPQSYIDAGELQLDSAGDDFYQKNSDPKTKFRAPVDPIYLLENNINPKVGDFVTIEIPEAGISKLIRIIRKTTPIDLPFNIELELAEQAVISGAVRNYIRQENVIRDIGKVTQQAQNALAQSANAKRTAEIVASVTSFLSTTIDGNVVATGTLIVGDALGNNNAGITGVIEGDPATSVWLWGGSTYANRANAPYRVDQSGRVFMTKATISSSPTGARIEISSVENNLKLINTSNEVTGLFGGFSTYEGEYYTTVPPIFIDGIPPRNYLYSRQVGGEFRYYYANLGPGLSVGLSASDIEGFTSIGRKEVYSTAPIRSGKPDNSAESVMNENGFRTTGFVQGSTLNISGAVTANGIPTISFVADVRESTDIYRYTYTNGWITGRVKL